MLFCIRVTITTLFLVLTMNLAVPERASAASQLDTSGWKSHRSAQWGFDISVPPDWVELNMPPSASRRMTLTRKLDADNGRSLMCVISANDEPRTIRVSQQEINEKMLIGPPSIQEAQADFTSAGLGYRVRDVSLTRLLGIPVFLYELSSSLQSVDVLYVSRDIMIAMYLPGRSYQFVCSVWAGNEKDADALYPQWLPTLRRILSTLVIELRP